MNIQELEDKHLHIMGWDSDSKLHTKLSVEFGIELLNTLISSLEGISDRGVGIYVLKDRVKELKQYLNEE